MTTRAPGKKTGITQRVWLFLLEHGGHWTVAELAEQMGCDAPYMDKILWSMHDVGSVSKVRSRQRKNGSAFGVSLKNRIPQRMLLAAVVNAMTVRQAIDATEPAANDSKAQARAQG